MADHAGTLGDAPLISVIIATRDRPDDLARCLASVLACDHDSFEVIVVDQSEPPSPLPADSRVIHIPTHTHGKSAALNLAIPYARANLIAFTDDDCTVPPDWLRRIEELFARHPDVAMAFGQLQPMPHDMSQVFVPFVEVERFRIIRASRLAHVRGGGGANMAARRSMFDAIGGYDEQIGPGSRFRACEEYDMYYRALAGGQAVAFAPEITTTHWGARPWADGSGKSLLRSYAYGEGAVMGKHLRLHDRHMALVAARITAHDLRLVIAALPHWRTYSGLGQLAYKWRGLADGVMAPVDRRRHVFVGPCEREPVGH